MSDVLAAYLKLLLRMFEYDVAVMSQPWMYWCLLIPICFYLVFFVIKWLVLTAPFTIIVGAAAAMVRSIFSRSSKE